MDAFLHSVIALCRPGAVAQGGLVLGLLVAGAAGSVMHCTPMCGGFVLGQVADRMARLPAARLCEWQRIGGALLLPYHFGRIATYAALGAAAAASAGVLGHATWFSDLSAALLILAALLFLNHALRRLVPVLGHVLPGLDRAPAGYARLVARLTGRVRHDGVGGGFLLGVSLGFLPCGFLYAALVAAAASMQPVTGAVAMAAFGAGTAPSLIIVGVAGQAAGRRWNRDLTRVSPFVMVFNAALLLALAWQRLLLV